MVQDLRLILTHAVPSAAGDDVLGAVMAAEDDLITAHRWVGGWVGLSGRGWMMVLVVVGGEWERGPPKLPARWLRIEMVAMLELACFYSSSSAATFLHAPPSTTPPPRQHIEECMGSVREEMNLLANLDGSTGGGERLWGSRGGREECPAEAPADRRQACLHT